MKKLFFIHYYIETFLPCDSFFWYSFSICFFSSDILRYLFFPYSLLLFLSSSDKFIYIYIYIYIYILLTFLISLYHIHNNLLLYLVSRFCFFDNKLNQLFFKYNKKIYKTPILSIKLELFIMLTESSLLIYQKWIL